MNQRSSYEYTRQDARAERQVWDAVEEFLRERYDERVAMQPIPVYLETEVDYE